MPSTASSPPPSTDPDPLDDHDESVRIAVSALGDMKNGARRSPSSRSPPPSPPPAESASPDFVSRVSSLPLVGSALRAYEHGKASSRVVKYGAEMMESSVKNISRPVIDRLPVDVNQLDEFACRQLDRLERYRRTSTSDDKMQVDSPSQSTSKMTRDDDGFSADGTHDPSRSPESRTPTPQSQDHNPHADPNNNRQVISRSRWQTVLLEAGGIGAAVSEESMRRLKYCLQWLQYATAHIDSQILILRDFIDSLQSYVIDSSESDAYISPTHMRTLHDVRRDVVNTIRQVVDVVSKYAGSALPEPARARVRAFILHLPRRWASAANASATHGISEGTLGANSVAGASAGGTGNTRRGLSGRHRKERGGGGPDRSLSATPVSSRAPSPLASPRVSMGQARPTASGATRTAQHVLTLATESLDMMRGVTGVVKESLDRADAWVERLRIIGVQRPQSVSDMPFDSVESTSADQTPSSSSKSSSLSSALPGLTTSMSTPSTPALADTPLSTPSTPGMYASPDGLRMGIRLGEMSARASLSELRLDEDIGDVEGRKTPRCGLQDNRGRAWEKRHIEMGLEDERREMMVDG